MEAKEPWVIRRSLRPSKAKTPMTSEQSTAGTATKVVHGATITALAGILSQLIRLASTMLLTRLLYPEAYGLMAIILPLQRGLHMMSDLGTNPAIIQSRRGEETEFLSTAFTMEFVRGLIIAVVLALAAYPAALFYGQPELTGLILLTAFLPVLEGLRNPKLILLQRDLRLGLGAIILLVGQIFGVVSANLVAYLTLDPVSGHGSYWALPLAILVNALVTLIWSWALPGPKVKLHFDRACFDEIFHMGKWIFLSTLITFFASDIDVLMLGKLISTGELGLFNVGSQLASLPLLLGGQILGSVLLPSLAQVFRTAPDKLPEAFAKGREVLLPVGMFTCLATGLYAPAFFALLYDERYHNAGFITFLIMLKIWFVFMQEAYTRVTLAIGEAKVLVTSNVVRLATTLGAGLVGYFLGDSLGGHSFEGFLIGIGIGTSAGAIMVGHSLGHLGLNMGGPELRYTLIGVVLGYSGFWVDEHYRAPLGQVFTKLLPSFMHIHHVPEVIASTLLASIFVVPFGLLAAIRLRRSLRASAQA